MSDIVFAFPFQLRSAANLLGFKFQVLFVSFLSKTVPSVQIVVFVVLRAIARQLQREALVGELIHPDARHHLHRSLVGAPFLSDFAAAVA